MPVRTGIGNALFWLDLAQLLPRQIWCFWSSKATFC